MALEREVHFSQEESDGSVCYIYLENGEMTKGQFFECGEARQSTHPAPSPPFSQAPWQADSSQRSPYCFRYSTVLYCSLMVCVKLVEPKELLDLKREWPGNAPRVSHGSGLGNVFKMTSPVHIFNHSPHLSRTSLSGVDYFLAILG
jgi:hypothetical protein